MTHPSLGLPAADRAAGFPAAADRLRAATSRLGARALEVAIDRDATFTERHDELSLRHLLRDTEILVDRLALCVATGDARPARHFGEWVAPLYRRRRVPMDDLIHLLEGLRVAAAGYLAGDDEAAAMNAAVDAGIEALRWHRRIAGDARRRNRLLEAIYKGA